MQTLVLVGERGGGWRMITTQLNHERVGLAAFGGPAWLASADITVDVAAPAGAAPPEGVVAQAGAAAPPQSADPH